VVCAARLEALRGRHRRDQHRRGLPPVSITVDEYFQDSICNYAFTPTSEDFIRAYDLVGKVNAIFPGCELRSGHRCREKTLALIASGHRAALGGEHEKSNAIDIADPDNHFDDHLDDEQLELAGLYREHPDDTHTWVHLQRVPPKSGHRTFKP
jgi:hypothetical protein